MTQYVPLDGNLSPGGHMTELIAGSGGHKLVAPISDTQGRIAWSAGPIAGALYLTLDGAAAGGTATAIDWAYRGLGGAILRAWHIDC
jgi:hypothetical protein